MISFGKMSCRSCLSVILLGSLTFDLRLAMNTKSVKAEMNLPKLIAQFGDNERCRAYLTRLRWPKGIVCPRCGSKNVAELTDREKYNCNGCLYQFTVTSGTIFHDTHLSLSKWFLAIYFMTYIKKGVSS